MFKIRRKAINQLIVKYGHEINKLLVDETGEEFESTTRGSGGSRGVFRGSQPDYFLGTDYPHQNTYYPSDTHEGYNYPKPNGNTGSASNHGYNYNVPNQLQYNSGAGNFYNEESPDPIYIPRPR